MTGTEHSTTSSSNEEDQQNKITRCCPTSVQQKAIIEATIFYLFFKLTKEKLDS